MCIRNSKTISDLKRLQDIQDLQRELYLEIEKIKKDCSCFDLEPRIVETFAFEFTPRAVCVVCGKETSNLSFEQKLNCLREFFDMGGEDDLFSEEALKKMATDGGYTSP